jgi:putative addiction module killer protein
LNAQAAAKVVTALVRIEQGNMSNTKSVGSGVFECRIDFGPGYRVYFGKDGDTPIILLGGGTKKRQQKDIQDARKIWKEYKQRKKLEA